MDNELRDDVISAAIDGEQVDVDELRRALQTEDGRETLAAFVLLRAATAADEILPTRRVAEFARMTARSRPLWPAPSRLRLACAASIGLLALVASFWFGTTLRGPVLTVRLIAPPTAPAMVSGPPTIVAPTAMVPGDLPMPTTARTAGRSPVPALWEPPRTARLLSFVPGVDWTSTPE
jgi:hypothetical protein